MNARTPKQGLQLACLLQCSVGQPLSPHCILTHHCIQRTPTRLALTRSSHQNVFIYSCSGAYPGVCGRKAGTLLTHSYLRSIYMHTSNSTDGYIPLDRCHWDESMLFTSHFSGLKAGHCIYQTSHSMPGKLYVKCKLHT